MKGGQDTGDWEEDGRNEKDRKRSQRSEVCIQASVRANTFPLFLDGLGLGHGETLHGLVLLPAHVLLLGRRPRLPVGVRVDQHAAVEGVAVSAGRVAVAMVD